MVSTQLKNISQLEWLFPMSGKKMFRSPPTRSLSTLVINPQEFSSSPTTFVMDHRRVGDPRLVEDAAHLVGVWPQDLTRSWQICGWVIPKGGEFSFEKTCDFYGISMGFSWDLYRFRWDFYGFSMGLMFEWDFDGDFVSALVHPGFKSLTVRVPWILSFGKLICLLLTIWIIY